MKFIINSFKATRNLIHNSLPLGKRFLKLFFYFIKTLFNFLLDCIKILFTKLIPIYNLSIVWINRFNSKSLPVIVKEYDFNGRYLIFTLSNAELLNPYDGLKAMFHGLINNKDFIKFGKIKAMIVSVIVEGREYHYHFNVLITNNMSFEDYYKKVEKHLKNHGDNFYGLTIIPFYKVRVWNLDDLRNKDITLTPVVKTYKNIVKNNKGNGVIQINRKYSTIATKPIDSKKSQLEYITNLGDLRDRILKRGGLEPNYFGTMDIETINIDSKQVPICITSVDNFSTKLFLVDIDLFKSNQELAVDKMWKEYFDYLKEFMPSGSTIFAHNLGNFDGYFLHKALIKHCGCDWVNPLIDQENRFISNTAFFETSPKKGALITWKDSYRIFPVSLKELCKIFNVEGKISDYNIEFNKIEMFDNPDLLNSFLEYSLQDSICLYNALRKAQAIYCKDYIVDITRILSTASLSLRIFRLNYLSHNIPILKGSQDSFIRESYLGGATDYYIKHAKKVKPYDVNSLYPSAMRRPMPFELINEYKDMSNIKLDDFFGFALARVKVSKDILIPLLPYKYKGRTIFPTGEWEGVYFSEELKEVQKHGYEIQLIRGYEFSKEFIFNRYVYHFYDKKAESTGAERFIAKMHLNQLYGIFGRKQETISTVTIPKKDVAEFLSTNIIKGIIELGDFVTMLCVNNIPTDIIQALNSTFKKNVKDKYTVTKSNVAIASAVTSYARIDMIRYKVLFGEYLAYTDTDSLYLTIELPSRYIGKDLGLMKDELNGLFIEEAYFLDIKKYGYFYIDSDGNKINKSVVAGYQRDGLTFEEIKYLADNDNNTIVKKSFKDRLVKSFSNLDILLLKNPDISISGKHSKILKGNRYLPPHIHELPTSGYLNGYNKSILFINHIIQHYHRISNRVIKLFKSNNKN